MHAVHELSWAFALAAPHEEALAIRDDVAFFQAVRAGLAKRAPGEAKTEEELNRSAPESGVVDCSGRPWCSWYFGGPRNCENPVLYHQVIAARPELQLRRQGSTSRELAKTQVENTAVAVLPNFERCTVAAFLMFLDRETSKIDALVAKVREGIDLLKKYLTTLISAAVTGKTGVREEAASR